MVNRRTIYKSGVVRRQTKKIQETSGVTDDTDVHNIIIKNDDGILQGYDNFRLVINDDTDEPENFIVKDLELIELTSNKTYFNRQWFISDFVKDHSISDSLKIEFKIKIKDAEQLKYTKQCYLKFDTFCNTDDKQQSIYCAEFVGFMNEPSGNFDFVRIDYVGDTIEIPEVRYNKDSDNVITITGSYEFDTFETDDTVQFYYTYELKTSTPISLEYFEITF